MADEELGSVPSSPISTLHPDVLGEIFRQCDRIYTIYIEDPRPPLHYTLSKVCTKWRETVQSSPSLWRKFGINFNDEGMENAENLEIHARRLDICLRLSGALGLELELRYDASKLESEVPPFLEVAASKLGEHSDRWVSLDIRPATPAFLSIIGTKAVKGIPRLSSFNLDFVNILGPLEACLPWCDAPKLRGITLICTTINDRVQPHLKHIIPWWQITQLELKQTTIPYRELKQLLERTPNLLYLGVRAGEIEGVTKKITPVHLEYLVSLEFVPPMSFNFNISSPGSGLPQIFDILDCPNLTCLSVWPSPLTMFMGKGAAARDILDFTYRTKCKLKMLDMGLSRIEDVEILIREIHSLTTIIFTTDLREGFLSGLAKALTPSFTLDGMDIPAPNLRSIYLNGKVAGGLSGAKLERHKQELGDLVEALEHRVRGSPSLPVYGIVDFRNLTLMESRHRIRNSEMPEFDPEVYQPLLNFCRKHRLNTKVNVEVSGRGEFEQFDGRGMSGSIERDGYRVREDTVLFKCFID
ncbi:hypothetical protein EST38_g8875 [Candolleomyces aberdarensis]|uniref:F-box domain-containing protein n=1 Tax=Candolleomyces aberdarensis TaxID=2316362 RepID=A0A4Q2DBJ3_9AGAR|nr:hypothetical protein EST38_g8875 [Candolleomyces aberdarensis]